MTKVKKCVKNVYLDYAGPKVWLSWYQISESGEASEFTDKIIRYEKKEQLDRIYLKIIAENSKSKTIVLKLWEKNYLWRGQDDLISEYKVDVTTDNQEIILDLRTLSNDKNLSAYIEDRDSKKRYVKSGKADLFVEAYVDKDKKCNALTGICYIGVPITVHARNIPYTGAEHMYLELKPSEQGEFFKLKDGNAESLKEPYKFFKEKVVYYNNDRTEGVFVISAGPSNGRLNNNNARVRNVDKSSLKNGEDSQEISITGDRTDTSVIHNILISDRNYTRNYQRRTTPEYAALPSGRYRNSNSYIFGILEANDLKPRDDLWGWQPGHTLPVGPRHFAPPIRGL